ncbi:MAG: helix-turn-helix domain-containing protein [Solirubrobacteraceae bacterium]
MVPLFVRIPGVQARRLHSASFERGRSKQALVSEMMERYLGADGRPRRFTVGALEPKQTQIGHASFSPYEDARAQSPEGEVLSADGAAELLKVERALVERLAGEAKLPGRRLAGEWRFARVALLAWLSHGDAGPDAGTEAAEAGGAGVQEGASKGSGRRSG